MKKLVSLALALLMIFSLATVAMAADYVPGENFPGTLKKTYTVNSGTAPAETFNFHFGEGTYAPFEGSAPEGYTVPKLDDVSIAFDEEHGFTGVTKDLTAQFSIDPNDGSWLLGTYTYPVNELPGTTAGVDYSEEKLELVLTILRSDDAEGYHFVAAFYYQNKESKNKTEGFTNYYDAGSLKVTKHIVGNQADEGRTFTFTVTFTAPADRSVESAVTVKVADTDVTASNPIVWNENKTVGTWTGELGDDVTVEFINLPEGVIYEVTENADGYESTAVFDDETKTIGADTVDTVEFTNKKDADIDTGILLDSAPYILLLVVAFFGMTALMTKKRHF